MMAAGTLLVWFGQVQVLEEKHHSLTVFWLEDTASTRVSFSHRMGQLQECRLVLEWGEYKGVIQS